MKRTDDFPILLYSKPCRFAVLKIDVAIIALSYLTCHLHYYQLNTNPHSQHLSLSSH